MGSITSPPCEENVVWFVASKPVGLGSTMLSMLRDALNFPGKTPHDKLANYDGSNRYIFYNIERFNKSKVELSIFMMKKKTVLKFQQATYQKVIGKNYQKK